MFGEDIYTTMKTAMKMDAKPTHVSQAMLWNFRTEAVTATTIVARNDHHTVHAACVERAFNPIDTPRIPEPAQSTYAIKKSAPVISLSTGPPSTAAISAIE